VHSALAQPSRPTPPYLSPACRRLLGRARARRRVRDTTTAIDETGAEEDKEELVHLPWPSSLTSLLSSRALLLFPIGHRAPSPPCLLADAATIAHSPRRDVLQLRLAPLPRLRIVFKLGSDHARGIDVIFFLGSSAFSFNSGDLRCCY
jgi:hypothetical protein